MATEFNTKLCMGCMEPLADDSDVCPLCGYNNAGVFPSAIPPETILNDRYLVGRVLSEGRFGTKYIAFDIKTEAKVIIRNGFAENQANHFFKSMLERDKLFDTIEQHISTAAEAPNFLASTDVFMDKDVLYLVEPYCSGMSIADYVNAHGPIQYNNAMHIFMRVALALKSLHSNRIVYGLLCPERVYLTAKADAMLGDTDPMVMHFADSKTPFLPEYFTPCECRNAEEKTDVSAVSDIYSLGALLYYMLCGQNVKPSDEREYDDDVLTLSEMGISVPKRTEDMLMHALELYPEDRYASVDELLRDVSFIDKPAYALRVATNNLAVSSGDDEPDSETVAQEYLSALEKKDEIARRKELQLKNIVGQPLGGEDAETHVTPQKEHKSSKRAKKAFPLWAKLVIICFFGIALVAMGLVMMGVIDLRQVFGGGKYVAVPNVVTHEISDAKSILESNGLYILVKSSTDKTGVAAGQVCAQYPTVKTKLLNGTIVCVEVSRGVGNGKGMPNLSYMQLADAYQLLRNSGLNISVSFVESTEILSGCVVEQSIVPGDEYTEGDALSLVVSAGSALQNMRIRVAKLDDISVSTVVFMSYGKIYDIRKTASGTCLGDDNMPATPLASVEQASLVFVGWSLGDNGTGIELKSTHICNGIIFAYSYFAQGGVAMPTLRPEDTSYVAPTPIISFPIYTIAPPDTTLTPGETFITDIPTEQPTATPIATEAPILTPTAAANTPVITPTQEPTPTPIPPTPTPTPIPTPTPTPTTKPRVDVTGVTLSPSALTLKVGETYTLNAQIAPQNATNQKLTWRSYNNALATIDQSGVVTALHEGTVRVYVITNDGYYQANCDITIVPAADEVNSTSHMNCLTDR